MLQFGPDGDFDTKEHRAYRDDGWMGGPYTELTYFLSCLTRVNYARSPFDVWDPAMRAYVAENAPESAWITESTYFHPFALLILRELYRCSKLGKRYPIRAERRAEKAARFVIANPRLSLEDLASQFGTTVKQLKRNSNAMLALLEFSPRHHTNH